jgi:DNA-binding transcriptional MerR regulator/methylmalonyl-CoA mutase cobalamin-binding subunit
MYTIKQASELSGVGIPLLRAWEHRYGVVEPARTASRYRLYDDEAIARLRAMRRLVDAGWTASQAAVAVLEEAAERGAAGAARLTTAEPADPGRPGAEAAADELVTAFVAAAARYDAAALEHILDAMLARGSVDAVLEDLILPAVRALGDEWVAGRLDVAEEHLASAAVIRRLSTLYDLAGAPGTGPRVLVGMPPSGRHEIGALAFAIALRRRGAADVLYLGADVPVESWVAAAQETGATAAVIGVTRMADVERARNVARALVDAQAGLIVAFGGAAAPHASLDLPVLQLPAPAPAAADALASEIRSGR